MKLLDVEIIIIVGYNVEKNALMGYEIRISDSLID